MDTDHDLSLPEVLPSTAIEHVPVSLLRPYPGNARTHSPRQIAKIADSIRAFGFVNPILIDERNGIIAGHGRLRAAERLGLESVPVLRIDHLNDDQIRAYVIADNRLAELAGWDEELLAIELQHLMTSDLEFGLDVIGFEAPEIDLLIGELDQDRDDQPEDVELPDTGRPAVTRSGDLWCLGEHRLVCGDALQEPTFDQLMGESRARMVFTDPPYNVPIKGHVSGKGKACHREFAMASGEMEAGEFAAFLEESLSHMAAFSHDGALHYVCMDWRHMGELLAAGREIYTELKNLCIWAKTNGGMGSFYRSQHELIFAFKLGTGPHINNIELGRFGRNRTNVWHYAGVNAFGPGRGDALTYHPTVKPVAMIADAIRDATHRGDIVLDGFCGSGSTILATERTGRRCYAIDLDPLYVDTAIGRWQEATGESALLAGSDRRFVDVAADRAQEQFQTAPDASCVSSAESPKNAVRHG